MSRKDKITVFTENYFSDVFNEGTSDKDRIKYVSKMYSNLDISDAFAKFYNIELSKSEDANINKIVNIEVGNCYWGEVTSINKSGISFVIPGVKEEIVSKENFSDCMNNIMVYLQNSGNKLRFEVREKRRGVFYVSVINAYYKLWQDNINYCIKKLVPISVHIDSLTKGGYLCHTNIKPLFDLTGKEFTSSVFIPGSNIVLNIEHDFEKWIGKDVQIIPQKIVKYKQVGENIENSVIGSRKLVLQQLGNNNLFEIYNTDRLIKSTNPDSYQTFVGTVTGIINSNKKTGIFVELNDKYITGLMPLDSSELLNYKPGDQINVKIKEFEIQEGKEPFILNVKNQVIYSNTRCIFELV